MSSGRKKDVLYLKILNTVISKNGKGELMIIETNSEKETWDLGFSLGEKACAGQVYTLVGDLGSEVDQIPAFIFGESRIDSTQ